MIRPRIILARGIGPLARDAIVLDHANYQIWHRGQCVLRSVQRPPITSFRIAAILLMRAPDLVTHSEMIDHLYGEDAEGGPLDPMRLIKVLLNRPLRPLFEKLGFACVNRYGVGLYLRSSAQAWNDWKAAA
jgi:hypothetical protein